MKKIYLLAVALAGTLLTSCSDFLDKVPLVVPSSETFLTNQSAVTNYVNGLYIALPSAGAYGMGIMGEEKNSDNMVAMVYDRRMNGELQESIGGVTEWQKGYQNLRSVNYFLEYYKVPAAEETAEVLSLKGEAYFFRAYWHYYLLTKFGSIPVMDKFWDGNATVGGLQIPARDRSAVAQFILDDLKAAKELLYSRSKYQGLRICKEAAMVMAMRVALFEGTWEKYHKGTDFAAAEYKSDDTQKTNQQWYVEQSCEVHRLCLFDFRHGPVQWWWYQNQDYPHKSELKLHSSQLVYICGSAHRIRFA